MSDFFHPSQCLYSCVSKLQIGSGYSTRSGLLEKNFKNQIAYFTIVMSCPHDFVMFSWFCHALCISITLSRNFATAVRSVAICALESYAAGSEFKARWSHNFYFMIEIES